MKFVYMVSHKTLYLGLLFISLVPDFIVVLFKMTCYRLIKLSIIIIFLVGGLCGSDLSDISTGLLWITIE